MRTSPVQAVLVTVLVAVPVAILATITATQAYSAGTAQASVKNPVEASPASIAAGEKIYAQYCTSCHAADATGGPPKDAGFPPAANLVDGTWDYGSTDGDIFKAIQEGIQPEMVMEPWFDRISETDTWNVINYIRDLAKKTQ